MEGVLVVVPCGRGKVWDGEPNRGPTPACDAYTGAPFKVNRAYAERFADRWVILSARYGFVRPDFVIPGPYDVTFKDRLTHPISVVALQKQIREQDLGRFREVIGLGGADYQSVVVEAFADVPARIAFPFAGLPIGKAMQATQESVRRGERFGGRAAAPPGESGGVNAPEKMASESRIGRGRMPTAEDFRRELESMLEDARRQGRSVLEVTSGTLHRRVGGYPGTNHRMPMCCEVMRARMGLMDEVVHQPPRGKGASLTIRYRLGTSR